MGALVALFAARPVAAFQALVPGGPGALTTRLLVRPLLGHATGKHLGSQVVAGSRTRIATLLHTFAHGPVSGRHALVGWSSVVDALEARGLPPVDAHVGTGQFASLEAAVPGVLGGLSALFGRPAAFDTTGTHHRADALTVPFAGDGFLSAILRRGLGGHGGQEGGGGQAYGPHMRGTRRHAAHPPPADSACSRCRQRADCSMIGPGHSWLLSAHLSADTTRPRPSTTRDPTATMGRSRHPPSYKTGRKNASIQDVQTSESSRYCREAARKGDLDGGWLIGT